MAVLILIAVSNATQENTIECQVATMHCSLLDALTEY